MKPDLGKWDLTEWDINILLTEEVSILKGNNQICEGCERILRERDFANGSGLELELVPGGTAKWPVEYDGELRLVAFCPKCARARRAARAERRAA